MRAGLRLLVLAACAASGAAAAQGHQHRGGSGCDGPEFSCAREATPTFAPDGTLWLAWSSDSLVYLARSADRGASFAPPVEITRGPVRLDHAADARPQLVVDDEGRVTVGYAVMTDGRGIPG